MKKLLFLAAAIGVVVFLMKKSEMDRTRWQGMSEDEVRTKLGERLPSRMPEEKREAVTDKIVTKMRDKGVIEADDPIDLDAARDAANDKIQSSTSA